jgi:hypothetical protein
MISLFDKVHLTTNNHYGVSIMEMTIEKLSSIIVEAHMAAYDAADKYFKEKLGGQDQFACGFAWTSIHEFEGKKINGNTKIGRMLKKCGVTQNYYRTFRIWNPSKYPVQNVDTLEAGARAAAEVFEKYGFRAVHVHVLTE